MMSASGNNFKYKNKYLKYKNKYLRLKQVGGTIIYNLIHIIKDSVKDNTYNEDYPVDPHIICDAITAINTTQPFKVHNHYDVINNSSIVNVFSDMSDSFRYIQIKFPTLTLTNFPQQHEPPISHEFSNFYLCKFITEPTIYWLIEIGKKKHSVTKIDINKPRIISRL